MRPCCHAGWMSTQVRVPSSRAWGRRLVVTAAAAGSLAVALPAAAEEAAPTVRCTVTDERLAELSGLVVVGEQTLALNDGGDQVAVYGLDRSEEHTSELQSRQYLVC